MSTVQSTNAVSQSLLDSVNGKKDTVKSTADAAQDRFMTLLVTQMKNQDPLNPMDNAQVTSQLAQLSTVTGIDKLNTSLQGLMGSYQSSQSLQATNMIGHGVLVPGSNVDLASSKGILGIEMTEAADNLTVTIKNSSGKTIRDINLGPQDIGTVPLAWDGIANDGSGAADGHYTFSVNATRGGEKIAGATGLTFGSVSSVSTNAQGVKLNIPNVGAVNLADVRQIL